MNGIINCIISIYASKLNFKVLIMNIINKKIHNYSFKIFLMIEASFSIKKKLKIAFYFQKTCLRANTLLKIIFKMFFLFFNNTNIKYLKNKLI